MRMRWARFFTAGSSLAAAALASHAARAQQLDVNPPKPNVLLLIDNSGSMERMIDGTLPEANPANICDVTSCTPNAVAPGGGGCVWSGTNPVPNRWNTLVDTLVGSPVNGFHCIAMPRDAGASSDFVQEYQINGISPYDTGYYIPYHRAVALDQTTSPGTNIPCVFAPGDLPGVATGAGVGPSKYGGGGTADQFSPGTSQSIVNRPYGEFNIDQSTGHQMACQFAQNNDGALTAYQDILRFAFMTFDQDTSAATGVSATAPLSVNTTAPFVGMWSYFPGWDGVGTGTPASGNPLSCATGAEPFEVGARNPAAPPWEGRMVPFPPPSDAQSARDTQNQQIRQVLAATRPYGGTPIAGMFADAMNYLWNDPNGPGVVNGSNTNGDSYIAGGCRSQYIILLTDGSPNLDLRPSCGTQDGTPPTPCPYNLPETIAAMLASGNGAHQPVTTYVIGFALWQDNPGDGGSTINCTTLDPTSSVCTNPDPTLAACCELQKIAVAGQPVGTSPTPRAYFANTATDLQAAISAILAKIAQNQTTRTAPTFSPVTSNITYTAGSSTANQSVFLASFSPGVPSPTSTNGSLSSAGAPWTGDIKRNRYLCSQTPPSWNYSASQGDDFAANLAQGGTRHFIAFNPSNSPVDATQTFRPFDTVPGDGLGNNTGTQIADTAANIISTLPPAALNLSGTNACPYTSTLGSGTGALNAANCAAMLLDFTFGQSFSSSGFPFVSRTGTVTGTNDALAFGGLYHAAPTVVGPPGALLHDDSYDLFRTETQTNTPGLGTATPQTRDTIVYAATTDGLLHAFWADEPNLTNNEEWAFLPPAVMPQLQSAYPGADQFLLDGTPIVKDVVWDRKQGSNGTSSSATNPWRTTLVASFGPSQLGYYAMDVTNPVFTAKSANYTETQPTDPGGPQFLWQITKVPTTNAALFGSHGATPAITQVAINESDGNVHEVGVAILPGGWNTAATTPAVSPGCERWALKNSLPDWGPTSGYTARPDVRCWGKTGSYTDAVIGRSVTVVRLDTGEVVATFIRKNDVPTTDTLLAANRIIDTPLDSPMTGTPAVYPVQTGSDATKFFIGDMDGTIWRFDISNPDPTQWRGRLFYDLYNTQVDNQPSGTSNDWSGAQPIALPLTLALDTQGRVVVIAASGSQDSFDLTGPNFLASVTETVQTIGGTTDFHAGLNWYQASKMPSGVTQLSPTPVMDIGEKVSGPMIVFNNTLYFTTYDAGTSTTQVCSAGDARLWADDFVTPKDTTLASGGAWDTIHLTRTSPNPYLDLVAASPQLAAPGVVVPGVEVQQTTACATTATGADQYVPGATHTTTTSFSQGSFSLVAQTGSKATGGGVGGLNMSLNAPSTSSIIDSWATVTE
jgi:type IV pilus assembly protein PilY1